MTTEERFTKIENFLNALADHQAQFPEQMAALRTQHETQHAQHAKEIAELREMQKTMVFAIMKVVEAQETGNQKFGEEMKAVNETLRATAEQQRITEEKLHALIETVDRIIRSRNT